MVFPGPIQNKVFERIELYKAQIRKKPNKHIKPTTTNQPKKTPNQANFKTQTTNNKQLPKNHQGGEGE